MIPIVFLAFTACCTLWCRERWIDEMRRVQAHVRAEYDLRDMERGARARAALAARVAQAFTQSLIEQATSVRGEAICRQAAGFRGLAYARQSPWESMSLTAGRGGPESVDVPWTYGPTEEA